MRFFVLSRQRELDGKTPAEVIRAGQVVRVIELVTRRHTCEEAVRAGPSGKETAKRRTSGAARLGAMSSRKPSRLRDQLGMRRPITAIDEERSGRYELYDEPVAPPVSRGRTTGITYSEPAF